MTTQGAGTDLSDDQFLQERLATLGKVMFMVTMLGLLLRGSTDALNLGASSLRKPDLVWNLVGNSTFGVLWALCSGKARARSFLTFLEAAVLFVACTAYATMGVYYRDAAIESYVLSPGVLSFSHQYFSTKVLLVLTYAMATRAAVVPSSAGKTRWLTGLVGVPLVVIATHGYTPLAPGDTLTSHAILNIVWWTFTVIICGVISDVIYGLRRKVIEARRLGQYTLEEKLGEGGIGMVYRASHGMLRRPTAIKLLRSERVKPIDLARFEREVRMTAKLTHPNTVTVFDYGRTPEDIFYYAMELLEGLDLERLVKASGPQSPERVRHILERIADALSEAHGIGLIHRDIKPSNIILCRQGGRLDVPKVVDFGLVQEVTDSTDLALTGDGQLLGTPLYMSPEVMRSPSAGDGRSDLYGLGAVGYYLLTGEHVFPGDNILEICFAHVHKEPIPPSKRIGRPISQPLEAIILSCLAKEPADRPQHAAELRDQLIACSELEPWTEDKAMWWWQSHPNVLAASFSSGEEDEEDETMARTVMFDRPTSS